MMIKFTSGLKIFLFCFLCLLFTGFSPLYNAEGDTLFIQTTLIKHYNNDAETKVLKRYELNITNMGLCRYKKFYSNGKTELFVFNIDRFKNLDYYGSLRSGQLFIRTENDDVIVQTYNDKKGDVDSMRTYVAIPLKEIDVEELNLLHTNFMELKKALDDKKLK